MSSFDIFGGAGEAAVPKSAAAFRSTQETVFVDVGARKIDANIVRDGVPIGIHEIDPDVLDDIIVERPPVRLTIVGQSVPARTPVPVGTAIDITLARPGTLPIGVITGVLTPLVQLSIDDGFEQFVAGNTQVRRIVSRAASGALSAADEQAVREIFTAQGVEITDEPGHDVDAAVETLRVLQTFGG
jgi:hypothetical protein